MKNLDKLAVGAGISATASYVWTLIPNNTTFTLASNPFAFLEHYHWGLVSMIVAKKVKRAKKYAPYLYGFGGGMVAIEALGSQPFAVGKPVEQLFPSVILGSGLLWALFI